MDRDQFWQRVELGMLGEARRHIAKMHAL